jgi:phosphoribosylformimino-5-aminoimidazole carboxamide ribotide isomerase
VNVVRIPSVQTHELRRRVLRSGEPDADVRWPEDDLELTVHFAVVDDDGSTVIGVSTWIETGETTQLRGMATDPRKAGRGIGTALLDAGIAHARSRGSHGVWANARVSALGFYTGYGFVISGPEFVTPATGLPHRLATFDIT